MWDTVLIDHDNRFIPHASGIIPISYQLRNLYSRGEGQNLLCLNVDVERITSIRAHYQDNITTLCYAITSLLSLTFPKGGGEGGKTPKKWKPFERRLDEKAYYPARSAMTGNNIQEQERGLKHKRKLLIASTKSYPISVSHIPSQSYMRTSLENERSNVSRSFVVCDV